MPSSSINFQTMIIKLQEFWAAQGCLIWQPYYTQVGAGTNNPATILRVLGPEPWQVGYVEPSVRPDDGRYGENPNRLQMHYQYQVILKPDPGNPQELYLHSLEAMGINPRQHDIRFVEDNWESPAFGAWGLGWEVWLDGQEITQFTYFQQACGQVLDPVSVEITYGLERIAIAQQRVGNFRDIQWSTGINYGDVNLQGEQEHSRYYFDVADVARQRQMYELYESEARICLEKGLVLPSLDYILKCSHTFNVLDSRGAVGVTERQAMFGRMRELSRKMAEIYLEQRLNLEYPFLKNDAPEGHQIPSGEIRTGLLPDQGAFPASQALSQLQQPFLLEIGTEELPAGDLDAALEQLRQRVPALLDELRLEHGEVRVMGTPRRLVVHVADIAPRQPDQEVIFRGPPAKRAFGPGWEATQAAEGFARSKGVQVSDLKVQEMDGGEYVVAVVQQPGRMATEALSEQLPGLVAALRFEKPMRWNSSNVPFSRPIRWLVALLGEGIVLFEFAGVQSGRVTRGLRFNELEEIQISSPEGYFTAIQKQNILLDPQVRRETIRQQVRSLAAEVGGVIDDDPALLEEVANLVEAPTSLRGSFDPAYLNLPIDVLISVMKKHQRYFPVYRLGGSPSAGGDGARRDSTRPSPEERRGIAQDNILLPYFITVRNGSSREGNPDLVAEGNVHVLRARFADAQFFVSHDLEHSLQDYLPRLGTLIFQTKLGSMLDKTRRMVDLVADLGSMLGLNPAEMAASKRAAELCKADLVTHMVVEMTSLQGTMGRYYALYSGEPEQVARAIYEHYLPRYSGDDLPTSSPGIVVGLADRLDNLVGLFAAGLAPSGNKDPFGQRRAALGLVQVLVGGDLDFDLRAAIQSAARYQPLMADEGVLKMVGEFITERLRNFLLEAGGRYDVVDAVLSAQWHNPARTARAVRMLEAWVKRPDWHTILPAYARCVRITRPVGEVFLVQEDFFVEDAEKDLWEALLRAEQTPRPSGSVDDFLDAFLLMIPAIDRFFEIVLVMTEDERLRQNRLGLLQRIAGLADGVADLSKLEGF